MNKDIIYYSNNLKELSRNNRKSGNLVEVLLWLQLKKKQLKGVQFTKQKPIDTFIVDFYAPVLKLAIEIDGSTHINLEKDIWRQKLIEEQGVVFMRFQNVDVLNNLEGVIFKISEKIDELMKLKKKEIIPL